MAQIDYVNPPSLKVYAKYISADSLILYEDDTSTTEYSGITIKYENSNGQSYPSATTITICARTDSPYTVSGITTTTEGTHRCKNDCEWTNNNDGSFSYPVRSDFIGSVHHTMTFSVLWSNGNGHDPKIVINPT